MALASSFWFPLMNVPLCWRASSSHRKGEMTAARFDKDRISVPQPRRCQRECKTRILTAQVAEPRTLSRNREIRQMASPRSEEPKNVNVETSS
eukprot:CAMPEP_0168499394 /NCGR_PEP_ID=MMETSP0228-20121227/73757_1 /TAXON_ID=133427 /ORGANISM="Protoceratium reticulatum, Strain CCCM 535 (=CCMP 1889)" /LENGTH=92 /DNA_ID=CAMNT_0008516297 /DNA_START=10 /DNA_END=284 /DNA_ORIENTATION=+